MWSQTTDFVDLEVQVSLKVQEICFYLLAIFLVETILHNQAKHVLANIRTLSKLNALEANGARI